MRRILLFALVLVVTALASSWLGYRAGLERQYTWIKGDFIATINALGKLRNGEADSAIRVLEVNCFSMAIILYENPELRNDVVPKAFLKELRDYRAMYRTNKSEWSPAEQRLEQTLATW